MPDVFLTGGKDREMSKCERWLSLIITAINERPLVTPLPFNQALCRPALATLVLLDEVIFILRCNRQKNSNQNQARYGYQCFILDNQLN